MSDKAAYVLRHAPDRKAEIPLPLLDLYSAELHESHRLLDHAGIPQSGYEEQLSISQRVALLVQENERLKAVVRLAK